MTSDNINTYSAELSHRWRTNRPYRYLESRPFQKLYDVAAKNVIGRAGVLDVGCWTGMFYNALRRIGLIGEYSGFDLCQEAVAEFSKRVVRDKAARVFVNDWWKYSCTKHYDVVYFGGVFVYQGEQAKAFLDKYLKLCTPKVVVIQDLTITDLNWFGGTRTTMHIEGYKIDEVYLKRQIRVKRFGG